MLIKSLDHIQLAMPAGEEAAARRFFGDLLGLAEIPKPPQLAPRGGCWFQAPGIQVHLGVQKPEFQPALKAHPAFLVADLEALRAKLAAAGVRIVSDEAVPGVRRFYADDPFGNRIEFIRDGDGFTQQG